MNRIAPLVEYRDLYENGRDRQANDVLLKTLVALIEADNAGVSISEFLRHMSLRSRVLVSPKIRGEGLAESFCLLLVGWQHF